MEIWKKKLIDEILFQKQNVDILVIFPEYGCVNSGTSLKLLVFFRKLNDKNLIRARKRDRMETRKRFTTWEMLKWKYGESGKIAWPRKVSKAFINIFHFHWQTVVRVGSNFWFVKNPTLLKQLSLKCRPWDSRDSLMYSRQQVVWARKNKSKEQCNKKLWKHRAEKRYGPSDLFHEFPVSAAQRKCLRTRSLFCQKFLNTYVDFWLWNFLITIPSTSRKNYKTIQWDFCQSSKAEGIVYFFQPWMTVDRKLSCVCFRRFVNKESQDI